MNELLPTLGLAVLAALVYGLLSKVSPAFGLLFSLAAGVFVLVRLVLVLQGVVEGIAALMNGGAGLPPYVFYFGLLTGATLGGNLTPIGASANIAAIGILRKNGETVRLRDFLRIGVPFTLSAVLAGYIYIWLVWGI